MKNLTIIDDSKSSLRKKSAEIKLPLEKHILDLANKMRNYLINSQDTEFVRKHPRVRPGVGLAAPQIGKNIRMFAVLFDMSEEEIYDYVLVNPIIAEKSDAFCYIKGGEGCLSVPSQHNGYVPRHHKITIKGLDLVSKREVVLKLEGYPAVVFQHEFDHLEGILFYDHINKENPFEKIMDAIEID